MATRSGTIDPGIVTWLVTEQGMAAADVADGLEHRSGLAGLAGTDDMRAVLARAASGDAEALLALEVYVHRLRGSIAAMAASLGGLDALVFTGGVGERSAPVRALAAEGLGFLGVALDGRANEGGDRHGRCGDRRGRRRRADVRHPGPRGRRDRPPGPRGARTGERRGRRPSGPDVRPAREQGASSSTLRATEPRTSRVRPVWPRVPTTSVPVPRSAANRDDLVRGVTLERDRVGVHSRLAQAER